MLTSCWSLGAQHLCSKFDLSQVQYTQITDFEDS